MNLDLVIAISGSALAIVGTVIALFLWNRSESNQDRRDLYAVMREDRKDILQIIRSIELEMKDFHHRMLEIEKSR